MSKLAVHAALLSLVLIACGDSDSAAEGEECVANGNDVIRQALSPFCGSCHGAGTVRPFFESLTSFEGLLAYDERYVVPGEPDESLLVELLEGTATGAYTQMPLSGATFAALADDGATSISMEELRDWITDLPPRSGAYSEPSREAIATRPLRAEEIIATLASQVGLNFEDDFVSSYGQVYSSPTVVLTGDFAVRSPDETPGLHYTRDSVANEYFISLGGPSWLQGVRRKQEIGPDFAVTLTQLSQAWCGYAIERRQTDALFRDVDADSPSTTHEAPIRENLKYVYLRMLGELPTDDEVDELYQGLFLPIEAQQSPRTAWVAVCSAMVRHPLWITY